MPAIIVHAVKSRVQVIGKFQLFKNYLKDSEHPLNLKDKNIHLKRSSEHPLNRILRVLKVQPLSAKRTEHVWWIQYDNKTGNIN